MAHLLARAGPTQSFVHHYPGMVWGSSQERTAPARPMSAASSLFDDLERALAAGSNAQRIEMLSRITDLFVGDAHRYSTLQIDLFDEVIAKLAVAIEAKARAKLSIRLADVPNAPTGVVRMLAFDDDIEVAHPVLSGSVQLEESDLIANASSKSQ